MTGPNPYDDSAFRFCRVCKVYFFDVPCNNDHILCSTYALTNREVAHYLERLREVRLAYGRVKTLLEGL